MASLVTAKELSNYLKLSESTIYKLASDGELPGFKIGDSWRFDMEEVVRSIRKSKRGNDKKREHPGKEGRKVKNGRYGKNDGSGR